MSSLQQSMRVRGAAVPLAACEPVSPCDGRRLMRSYESAALLPDRTIAHASHVAPALPLFEAATAAFARGTLIRTARGPVAIEDLLPGDRVESSEGIQPVLWIGSTTYVPGVEDERSSLVALSRITADTFGPGRPMADVLVGPAARMVMRRERLRTLIGQDRVLVPVADFADGDRIIRVSPAGAVQMYHLMLPRHGTLRVGGIEMESYHPGQTLGSAPEALRALFLGMFPGIALLQDFGELTLTRTTRKALDGLIVM